MLTLREALHVTDLDQVPPLVARPIFRLCRPGANGSIRYAITDLTRYTLITCHARSLASVSELAKTSWPKKAFFSADPPTKEQISNLSEILNQVGAKIVYVSADWKTISMFGPRWTFCRVYTLDTIISPPRDLQGPGLQLLDGADGAAGNIASGTGLILGAAGATATAAAAATAPILVPILIGGAIVAAAAGGWQLGTGIGKIINSLTPPDPPTPAPPVFNIPDIEIIGDPPEFPDFPGTTGQNLEGLPDPTGGLSFPASSTPGTVDDPETNDGVLGYATSNLNWDPSPGDPNWLPPSSYFPPDEDQEGEGDNTGT